MENAILQKVVDLKNFPSAQLRDLGAQINWVAMHFITQIDQKRFDYEHYVDLLMSRLLFSI